MSRLPHELEHEVCAGSKEAFGEWLAAHEHRLRRSLASFARTVDTESVLQETLLRVWHVAPRFEPDGKPDGLLRLAYRIARNLAITEHRKRRPTGPLPEDLADGTADAPPEAELRDSVDALRAAVAACMERLPSAPRVAIHARVNGSAARDDVLAARAGMKPNTFLQNIRRARLALMKCLRGRGFDLEYTP